MEPTVRSFSAEFDPLRLIARHPRRYPGILESVAAQAGDGTASYDILPIANGESLVPEGRADPAGQRAGGAGFLDALDAWCRTLPAAAGPSSARLPFRGGWFVLLTYEIAAEIEPRLQLPRDSAAPTAIALRAPAAWIREWPSGNSYVLAEPGAESLLDDFARHVSEAAQEPIERAALAGAAFDVVEEDPRLFVARVGRALEYIAAGDVYQANLSREWRVRAPAPIDPVAVYRRLRRANPAPFSALFLWGEQAVISSSPERLIRVCGRQVSTRPIAGTRPRGATTATDQARIRQLLGDEKERAEHVMLIDLERNDLGRVCAAGSVKVDEFMTVETYAHVHHIVSNVRGELRPDASSVDALRAVFPGGTITGCPKFRCMQIIAELEGAPRGAYTGSIGYLNRDGDADFNILIRTMSASGNELRFRAGAGIVADSRPASELDETRAKAEGLLRALR